jgi:hypothetical protein
MPFCRLLRPAGITAEVFLSAFTQGTNIYTTSPRHIQRQHDPIENTSIFHCCLFVCCAQKVFTALFPSNSYFTMACSQWAYMSKHFTQKCWRYFCCQSFSVTYHFLQAKIIKYFYYVVSIFLKYM